MPWPYLACGLALTLYMWVTVIDHSLTFFGWPMDLGHNLLHAGRLAGRGGPH